MGEGATPAVVATELVAIVRLIVPAVEVGDVRSLGSISLNMSLIVVVVLRWAVLGYDPFGTTFAE